MAHFFYSNSADYTIIHLAKTLTHIKIHAKLIIHINFSFSAGKIEQHQLFSAFDFSTVANFFVFLSEVCGTEKSPA